MSAPTHARGVPSRGLLWSAVAALVFVGCGGPAVDTAAPADEASAPGVTEESSPSPQEPDERPRWRLSDEPEESPSPPLAAPADDADAPLPGAGADPTGAEAPLPGVAVAYPVGLGREWAVFGVEAGDVLNVRSRPGVAEPIVGRLHPLAAGIATTGRARDVGGAVWIEIAVDGLWGWLHGDYVLPIANTVQNAYEAPVPPAATLDALARTAMETWVAHEVDLVWDRTARSDSEEIRRLVVVDRTVDTITVDVMDLYDDAVGGERIRIRARPHPDGLAIGGAETTMFCWPNRGGGPPTPVDARVARRTEICP